MFFPALVAGPIVRADYISQYNDLVFNMPGTYTGFESLMAVIGYTMQIYCDFSGYSDMAIGIARIMGYKSTNLTEFWRRWHISLSSWLRDYAPVFVRSNWIVKLVVFILLVQLVLQFRSETVSPFIYFQF